MQPYSGKVLSLVWTTVDSPHNLISCGPEGRMDWWKVTIGLPAREFHLEPLRTFWLPPSKQRWATCAELLILSRKNKVDDGKGADPYLLLCGDRKGSLHLYDPRQNCDKDQVRVAVFRSILLLEIFVTLCFNDFVIPYFQLDLSQIYFNNVKMAFSRKSVLVNCGLRTYGTTEPLSFPFHGFPMVNR